MEALIDRALALDEAFDAGAIHTFLISLRAGAAGRQGDPSRVRRPLRARGGALRRHAGRPYVSLAETVAVPQQDRTEFEQLLEQALAVDVDAPPQ